ncbi:zinc finger protein RFP-like [Osmerus eperlanus]|uniref:zinc finger protein RFP-like n=1 Tax=Osmerus eperlanus TaxID=29151 RepID=UPI002E15E6C4
MFCKTDKKFLCQVCCEAERKQHNVALLDIESRNQKISARKIIMEIQQMIQNKLQQMEEINQSVDVTKMNAKKVLETCDQVYTALINSIKKNQAKLIGEIMEKQKATQTRAERLIQDLEKEIVDLQRRSTELDHILHTEDHFLVLKRFSQSCHQPPPIKDWTTIHVGQEDFLSCVRNAVCEVEGFVRSQANQLSATELKRMQDFAVDITLDLNTAGPSVIISENGKQVRKSRKLRKVPNNPERFTKDVCVMAKQGFTSGRHYWEVEVGSKTEWNVGVATVSVNRKESIVATPDEGFFTIGLTGGNAYYASTQPVVSLIISDPLQIVGVFLDNDVGQVSFFNVKAKTHLFTYSVGKLTEKALPFFDPCCHNDGKDSFPLVIR